MGTIDPDACLQGMGGKWQNMVYHVPIERQYKNLVITQLEMLNILVAFKLFAKFWQNQKIRVRCDNLTVIQVLSSGKARDAFLGACEWNVWLIAARHDIDVVYSHVPGRENVVTDLLSRWQNAPQQFTQLLNYVPNPGARQ